ncbi:Anthranilate synthase component 2 [compost metagenome]
MIEDLELPESLEVTSKSTDDNYIMGIRHRTLPIEGVQYHPESILTENGLDIFRSFIKYYLS